VGQGKLAGGHPDGAPYDVIFVNGAIEILPRALEAQLAEGARLVVVIQKGPQGRANLFMKEHGRLGSRPDFDATVPMLPGFQEPRGFVF
jgi:protein-L-isoaspartate(D-aspartate) O-methyltransferase